MKRPGAKSGVENLGTAPPRILIVCRDRGNGGVLKCKRCYCDAEIGSPISRIFWIELHCESMCPVRKVVIYAGKVSQIRTRNSLVRNCAKKNKKTDILRIEAADEMHINNLVFSMVWRKKLQKHMEDGQKFIFLFRGTLKMAVIDRSFSN